MSQVNISSKTYHSNASESSCFFLFRTFILTCTYSRCAFHAFFFHFSTAGRTIRTGLTASAIVSSWTWAATLLQSSNVAWKYGVSGPFWYVVVSLAQYFLFNCLYRVKHDDMISL
jgi:Na+/proline symporter